MSFVAALCRLSRDADSVQSGEGMWVLKVLLRSRTSTKLDIWA